MRSARTKETRRLITAIRAAGGTVTVTSRGHLRVVGPAGVAILGSDPAKKGMGRANELGALRRHAGIDVGAASRAR